MKIANCAVHVNHTLLDGIMKQSLAFLIDIPLMNAISLRHKSIIPFVRKRIS